MQVNADKTFFFFNGPCLTWLTLLLNKLDTEDMKTLDVDTELVAHLTSAAVGCLLHFRRTLFWGDPDCFNICGVVMDLVHGLLVFLLPLRHITHSMKYITYQRTTTSCWKLLIFLVKIVKNHFYYLTHRCHNNIRFKVFSKPFQYAAISTVWLYRRKTFTVLIRSCHFIYMTYLALPLMSTLFFSEEKLSSCLDWQDCCGASGSDKALIGVQAMVSLLFLALCLQGAADCEPSSIPEVSRLSLCGAAEVPSLSPPALLPCIAASLQPPPFCSWLYDASTWLASVLLHSEPAERLFFRIPFKPGSES